MKGERRNRKIANISMLGGRALLEGFKIFRFFNNLKMYIVICSRAYYILDEIEYGFVQSNKEYIIYNNLLVLSSNPD